MSEEPSKEPGKGSKAKKYGAAAVLVLFLFAAMAAQTYYITSQRTPSGESSDQIDGDIVRMELKNFTVNLQDMSFRRYLRTTLTLEYIGKETGQEIEKKRHRIRNRIITILQSKSVADLNDSAKINALRKELTNAINGIVSYPIEGIYFQEFIIQ